MPAFANTSTFFGNQHLHLKKYLVITSILLIGVALQFVENIVVVIFLFLLLFLAAFSSICIVVVGLFSNKFKLIYLLGFVPLIFTLALGSTLRHLKFRKAITLQQELNSYKELNHKFPNSLQELSSTYLDSKFVYRPYNDRTEYEMKYAINGISKMYFDTKEGEWYVE